MGQLICECGKPAVITFRFPGKEWYCPTCKIASEFLGGHGKMVYRPPTEEETASMKAQLELFQQQVKEWEAANV